MSVDEPIGELIGALGAYFVGDVTVAEALDMVCRASLDAVRSATDAGISMTVDARIGTYAFTHPEMQDVDQAQYDTGNGPGVEAFRTGEPVVIGSTAETGPYPEFRRVAAQHGLLSVVSVPMRTATSVVGALNLYAPEAHAFDATSADEVAPFATHAAYLLANHQAYWDARTLSENLTQAMESRATIEQAKGIIMASTGCTPDEAFDQLKAQSQRENVKLREIAIEIVRRSQRHPDGDGLLGRA